MVNDPEKNVGSQPLRSLSLQVADGIQNPDQYTLKKLPWRLRTTPFSEILRQEYRGDGSEKSPFIITWLPNDPENPQTYGIVYKWTVTMIVAVATLAVALASSAFSGALESVEADFHPSTEVATLGVSLFVLGFALGPLLWAPISEVFGRRSILIFTYVMFTLWNGVAAASPNMAALLVFRFLAGAFGSSPLTNAGGTIADMFSAKMRGLATAIFAAAPFLGPAIGPLTGGFLGMTSGWRWVQGFLAIFSGVLTVISFLWVPETYSPTLLRDRAATLSKVTGKQYRASMDVEKPLHIPTLFKVSLSRPWQLLFREPIVLLISIYMAIVYGTLYMLFSAFPIVFQRYRGWNAGVGGLSFLGVLVGMLVGVAYTIFYENPRYIKAVDKHGGRAPPEERLPQAIVGSFLLVIGLAWFAATDSPGVHWIVPIMAGAPFGCGMLFVFLALMNYLVDCYVVYAASVLAANAVLRSLFGAAFPLFTTPMFKNIGIHWGVAVPGFLALACLPCPFLFWKYGPAIRKRCKYTQKAEAILQMMMAAQRAPAKKEDATTADQPSSRDDSDALSREIDREENEGFDGGEEPREQPESGASTEPIRKNSSSENTLAEAAQVEADARK